MTQRNKDKTRKRILEVALEKFSEKGFDAASISQISKTANVNQALIYYYFENKQAVLDELLDTFIHKANSFLIEIAVNGYAYNSAEMERQMEKYNNYILKNEKLLRLLLTESLKDKYPVPPIFRLIDFNVDGLDQEKTIDEMNARGFGFDETSDQRSVTEFFTGIMPVVLFSLFRKKWCSHFGIGDEELNRLFSYAVEETHSRHHENTE